MTSVMSPSPFGKLPSSRFESRSKISVIQTSQATRVSVLNLVRNRVRKEEKSNTKNKLLTERLEVCHCLWNGSLKLVIGNDELVQSKELIKHVGDGSGKLIVGKMQGLEIGQGFQNSNGSRKLVASNIEIHWEYN